MSTQLPNQPPPAVGDAGSVDGTARRAGERAANGNGTLAAEPVLALFERYACNPASALMLADAPWRFYSSGRLDAAAAYLVAGGTAMMWGDPLCPTHAMAEFVREATDELRRAHRRVCLTLVTAAVAHAARSIGYGVVQVGEEPMFDLDGWQRPRGRAGKTLRGYLNRAQRARLDVCEYRPGRDTELSRELRALQRRWELRRAGALGDSLLRPMPWHGLEHKRVFCVRGDGRVEAFVTCAPVPGRRGWLLEDLTRRSDGAPGATELLVTETLAHLKAGGARFAWLGMAPMRGFPGAVDPRARWVAPLVRPWIARFDRRYDFRATEAWMAKFRPTAWEPRYVAFIPRWPTPLLVRDALAALDP